MEDMADQAEEEAQMIEEEIGKDTVTVKEEINTVDAVDTNVKLKDL